MTRDDGRTNRMSPARMPRARTEPGRSGSAGLRAGLVRAGLVRAGLVRAVGLGVMGLGVASAGGQDVMRVPPTPVPADISGERAQQASPLRGYSLMLVEPPEPRTFAVHDKITIIINETSRSSSNQKLDTKTDASLSAEIERLPDLLNLLELRLQEGGRTGLTGVEASAGRQFKGDGKYERTDRYTDRITATVIDVKPNGVLVLEARRTIRKDEEEQVVLLTGECRGEDVTENNTILSSQLSDLAIITENEGQVEDAADKGFFTRLFEAVFNF